MSDEEVWLLLFHAALSNSYPAKLGGQVADEALEEYKKRWRDEERSYL